MPTMPEEIKTCTRCGEGGMRHRTFKSNGRVRCHTLCRKCEAAAAKVRIDKHPFKIEYRIWTHLRERCQNPHSPSFNLYGGRGISVCASWDKFEIFLSDMGVRPGPEFEIDRIDNNGNYCKSNCRWATLSEQNLNKRTNHRLTFKGITLPLRVWSRRTGIKETTLRMRIKNGWSVEKSLTAPVLKKSTWRNADSPDLPGAL